LVGAETRTEARDWTGDITDETIGIKRFSRGRGGIVEKGVTGVDRGSNGESKLFILSPLGFRTIRSLDLKPVTPKLCPGEFSDFSSAGHSTFSAVKFSKRLESSSRTDFLDNSF